MLLLARRERCCSSAAWSSLCTTRLPVAILTAASFFQAWHSRSRGIPSVRGPTAVALHAVAALRDACMEAGSQCRSTDVHLQRPAVLSSCVLTSCRLGASLAPGLATTFLGARACAWYNHTYTVASAPTVAG